MRLLHISLRATAPFLLHDNTKNLLFNLALAMHPLYARFLTPSSELGLDSFAIP
jgi:hypothetical protein